MESLENMMKKMATKIINLETELAEIKCTTQKETVPTKNVETNQNETKADTTMKEDI